MADLFIFWFIVVYVEQINLYSMSCEVCFCMTDFCVSVMHDRLIEKVSLKNPEETFSQVAYEIFSDGVYNWGRVVTLFYFAYKMIVRVTTSYFT